MTDLLEIGQVAGEFLRQLRGMIVPPDDAVGYSAEKTLPQIVNQGGTPAFSETMDSVLSTGCVVRGGMVTITATQVEDTSGTAQSLVNDPDFRVLLDVYWSGKNGHGSMSATDIDITRGTKFTIGWAQTLTVNARLRGRNGGAFPRKVSVGAVWKTSSTGVPAFASLDPVTLTAGAASSAINVPPFARSAVFQSDTPASLPNLTVTWTTTNVGGRVKTVAQTVNPNANSTLIAGGIEQFTMTQTGAGGIISPVFELWL